MEQNHALLASLRHQRGALKAQHAAMLRAHHESFHPVWGQLLKTGYQASRYAHQIDRFACLYTSHVSNLALYSPNQAFAAFSEAMAHEVAAVELDDALNAGGGGGDGGNGRGELH